MSAESWCGKGGVADNRDVILACGKDPYAYKGYTNESVPAIRSSRETIY